MMFTKPVHTNLDQSDLESVITKKKYHIFLGVLIFTLAVQAVTRTFINLVDDNLWTDQIHYVLSHDPKQFDFFGCYGHPGTSLIELSSILHVGGEISCRVSLALSESILIALSTALCSLICFLINPRSLWWLATAVTLSVNRLYLNATPTTAVVMPLVTLIVLTTWWLSCLQRPSMWQYYFLGAVVGMAAATRLDVSLLIGTSMFLLIWFKHGHRVVLPMLLATAIVFFISDPYMWFMPIQHIIDLVQKFTVHYAHFTHDSSPGPEELFSTLWLTTICLIWSLFIIFGRNRNDMFPTRIIVVLIVTTLVAFIVIFSSRYQAARYLFPICTVWEVFLPLYILETLSEREKSSLTNAKKIKYESFAAISIFVFIHLATYIIFFINIPPVTLI